jgi:ADP-ribose pyrophosphatase
MAHKRIANKPLVLGAGRWLRLVEVDGWEFVERVKATGVVAIDLPAGLAGDGPESEELVTAARRELIEETGYDARRFTLLAHAPTSPGLTTEVVSFFRAAGLKKVGAGGGIEGEDIVIHKVKLTRADAWLRRQARSGKHIDCKVLAGLHFAQAAGGR